MIQLHRAALLLVLSTLLALSGCAHHAQTSAGCCESAAGGGGAGATTGARIAPAKPLETLQREFVELRFGMFIHFGILTYTGSWSQANLAISQFNPTGLAACGKSREGTRPRLGASGYTNDLNR